MARKVRKQVYIGGSQERRLKERARQFDVPESELIREGLDVVLRRHGVGHRDERAWKAELSFMARRAARLVAQGKRTWSREELYEERLSRRH